MAYRRHKKPWRIYADGVNFGSRNRAAANMEEMPVTQRHGKRGLVGDRASGPDEVAIKRPTERFAYPGNEVVSRPTVIPKAKVEQQIDVMRTRGDTEWRYVTLHKHPITGHISKVYSGRHMFFAKEIGNQYWVSVVFTDAAVARVTLEHELIVWLGPYPTPRTKSS